MADFPKKGPLQIKSDSLRFVLRFVESWVTKHKFPLLCVMILATKILGFVLRVHFLLKSVHNMDILLDVLVYMFIPAQAVTKMLFLLVHHHGARYLITTISEKFWDVSVGDRATRKQLKKRYQFVNWGVLTHFCLCTGDALAHLIDRQVPIPEGRTRWLSLLMSLPFDPDRTPVYEILYAVSSWNMFMSVWGNMFFDFLFIYGAQHLSGQFIILKNVLKRLDEDLMEDSGDVERFKSEWFQREIEERISVCVQHHNLLITYGEELKNLTSKILGIQISVGMVSVIVILFTITENLDDVTKSVVMLSIVFSTFGQNVIFCLQSTDIFQQSATVGGAAYQSKWHLFNSKCKRALTLLILNSQNGIIMSAAGMVTINNEILVTMTNTIFSVLTLLRSFKEQ